VITLDELAGPQIVYGDQIALVFSMDRCIATSLYWPLFLVCTPSHISIPPTFSLMKTLEIAPGMTGLQTTVGFFLFCPVLEYYCSCNHNKSTMMMVRRT
jgi:hypothetical protein